jgi:hypothetical protein
MWEKPNHFQWQTYQNKADLLPEALKYSKAGWVFYKPQNKVTAKITTSSKAIF